MINIFKKSFEELLEYGFSVFPLSGGSKIPIGGTSGVHEATKNEAIAREWARRWPHANIAIAAGAPSGVLVIDFDPRNGSDASVNALTLNRKLFPATVESRTGNGGKHLFYAHTDNIRNSKSVLAPGIDVKTTGGYVVAPPSVLDGGKAYSWTVRPMGSALPRLPNWIVQALTPKPQPKYVVRKDLPQSVGPLARHTAKAQQGQRNNTLYWASCRAGEAIRKGVVSPAEAFSSLMAGASAAGIPSKEAEATIHSGFNMGQGMSR